MPIFFFWLAYVSLLYGKPSKENGAFLTEIVGTHDCQYTPTTKALYKHALDRTCDLSYVI